MDLALHFRCVNPLIRLGFRRTRAYNSPLSEIVDDTLPRFRECLSRRVSNGNRGIWLSSSSMGRRRTKKGLICCKKQSDEQTSNPSKLKQAEIVSLLRRIQSSISKERESGGVEEKNRDGSYENKTLSKAILDVLERPREKTEGDIGLKEETPKRQVKVARPPSSFAKRSPMRSPSGPKGKPPVSKNDKSLEEMTEKEEEKPPLIETMKLAELKEVAKNRGIKGYSKLKKSELLKLIRSS